MRSAHPLRHRELQREIGLLARLDCRRTDDSFGRSAALGDPDGRFTQDLERLVTDVGQDESGFDRLADLLLAEVDLRAVDRQRRRGRGAVR